ncbi:unnamed protein product [Didymodactylos carnosus]|uniref:BZIP domain-containing protein n=1 Tax=Didymodactylos carnosus TaxID=1234261 RepID=A0A813QB15_9BILA|nr:unnamed protein product [Didymodactylos carnosus]CAF1064252.1 unnamed protein product [Didymodactylos carnosus]CAF3545750.1 unnamed protein product [Didymodactylos carnosus]CAF3829483.1 unnamed protein product [Didymodactylos carnosus]
METMELGHYLMTPQIGGKNGFNPFSPDFLFYNDDITNIKQTQQHHGLLHDSKLFLDSDFSFDHEETPGNIDVSDLFKDLDLEWELQKLISCSSFPITTATDFALSPLPTEEEKPSSPMSSIDGLMNDDIWIGEECTIGIQSPISSPTTTTQYDSDSTSPVSSPSGSITSSTRTSTDSTTNDSTSIIKKCRRSRRLTQPEKKLRKKVQNKTAAEKYRFKKKIEKQTIYERRTKLESSNKDLQLEVDNLQYRITQLKQLFVDILHVKEFQQAQQNNSL